MEKVSDTGIGAKPLGPFETASDAMLAVRPADGSFASPAVLAALIEATLRTAGVGLGTWDSAVARWLAALDAQTVAVIAGWVSRTRPVDVGLICQALTDAVMYRSALSSGCPDCATAPEECADHQDDARRAAGYEGLLRRLVTGTEVH